MYEVSFHKQTITTLNCLTWEKEVVMNTTKKEVRFKTKTKEEIQAEMEQNPMFNTAWVPGNFFIEVSRIDSDELLAGIIVNWEELKLTNGLFAALINSAEDSDHEVYSLADCSVKMICKENDISESGNNIVRHFRYESMLVKSMGDLWTLFETAKDSKINDIKNYTIINA